MFGAKLGILCGKSVFLIHSQYVGHPNLYFCAKIRISVQEINFLVPKIGFLPQKSLCGDQNSSLGTQQLAFLVQKSIFFDKGSGTGVVITHPGRAALRVL